MNKSFSYLVAFRRLTILPTITLLLTSCVSPVYYIIFRGRQIPQWVKNDNTDADNIISAVGRSSEKNTLATKLAVSESNGYMNMVFKSMSVLKKIIREYEEKHKEMKLNAKNISNLFQIFNEKFVPNVLIPSLKRKAVWDDKGNHLTFVFVEINVTAFVSKMASMIEEVKTMNNNSERDVWIELQKAILLNHKQIYVSHTSI